MPTYTLPRLQCAGASRLAILCSSPHISGQGRASHSAARVGTGRREFMLAITGAGASGIIGRADACVRPGPDCVLKKGLTPEEIKAIVTADVTERKFLATANFTKEIYSPDCTFTDEIDSYKYEDFVKGTQSLFDGSQSTVNLVGDVSADDREVSFRFQEELAFNIPFKPKMTLSGKLTLERDEDGLIKSYTEKWDQSPAEVIRTVHL
mmetsp:Transcript_5730/g.16084  ORF Transcript_5730/g.16084 Transcript_5730/m.16084 type:complete len:208 (-) Transcript_5730:96-719(-)